MAEPETVVDCFFVQGRHVPSLKAPLCFGQTTLSRSRGWACAVTRGGYQKHKLVTHIRLVSLPKPGMHAQYDDRGLSIHDQMDSKLTPHAAVMECTDYANSCKKQGYY